MSLTISQLPIELQVTFISLISYLDLLSVCSVNKAWHIVGEELKKTSKFLSERYFLSFKEYIKTAPNTSWQSIFAKREQYKKTISKKFVKSTKSLRVSASGYSSDFPSLVANLSLWGNQKFYYEVELTVLPKRSEEGIARIGWSTAFFVPNIAMRHGVGDCRHSFGIHTHRKVAWHGIPKPYGKRFSEGDIIGCALDLENAQMEYFCNGISLGTAESNITKSQDESGKLENVYYFVPAFSMCDKCEITARFHPSSISFLPPGYRCVAEENDDIVLSEVISQISSPVAITWDPKTWKEGILLYREVERRVKISEVTLNRTDLSFEQKMIVNDCCWQVPQNFPPNAPESEKIAIVLQNQSEILWDLKYYCISLYIMEESEKHVKKLSEKWGANPNGTKFTCHPHNLNLDL